MSNQTAQSLFFSVPRLKLHSMALSMRNNCLTRFQVRSPTTREHPPSLSTLSKARNVSNASGAGTGIRVTCYLGHPVLTKFTASRLCSSPTLSNLYHGTKTLLPPLGVIVGEMVRLRWLAF
ncbi:uncharacterized protein LY79DRAFT_6101 [Colletotrichum navitas]|uniref:Uncharacterized protein n=1 Tax=Colletotrichum navitas TaxID=681940 RepID=A0AAD8QDN2_9PEZI|nr:uncharacterized protein LY79DRAFT_6101 [Colletotrichum navitas]KAK1600086.1 hypothetical protein LY79DRAFT_6101 [Colletotrichum navitas]